MPIGDILDEQNESMDSLVRLFREEIQQLVAVAIARTVSRLQAQLVVEGGAIKPTLANMRAMRSVDRLFAAELEAAGLDQAVQAFVDSFNGQLPYFQEILAEIGKSIGRSLDVAFTPSDLKLFAGQQMNTIAQIEAEVQRAGLTAKRQVLFSVAALSMSEMAAVLAAELGKSVQYATAIADTALPTFYRTVQDRGSQRIEEGLKDEQVRYAYYGPLDKLNRPFCRRMRKATLEGKTWTRKQIDLMDNGTPLPVMTTCGGWRCRHQWIVAGIKEK